MGRTYFELKNYLDAKEVFKTLLTFDISEEVRKETEYYLTKIERLVAPKLSKEKKVATHIMEHLSEDDPEEILKLRKEKFE